MIPAAPPLESFGEGRALDRHAIRLTFVAIVAGLVVMACATTAFAYDEPHGVLEGTGMGGCDVCHSPLTGPVTGCSSPSGCHDTSGTGLSAISGKGPHGLYSKTSTRCSACHEIHAATGAKLLPSATVTGACFTCHDGTGGHGVYGAVYARTGLQPGGGHRYDATSLVPGGDATSGGDKGMSFKGLNGKLGCDDCHSPHDSKTVAPFRVERWRNKYSNILANSITPGLTYRDAKTSHLLRTNPGGSATTAAVYGSDWCLACHAGRVSGGTLHNHPVDSGAGAFSYDNVALLSGNAMTGTTVLGSMAETNRGYVMPFPRTLGTDGQGTHKPICQQCHSDSRNATSGGVGGLSADGTQGFATPYTVTQPDGAAIGDNPRFQDFPHETENATMLVEPDDNLCLNCHPPVALP